MAKPSKKHPILAIFLDIQFFGLTYGAILVAFVLIFQQNFVVENQPLYLSLFLGLLLLIIIYHIGIKNKVKWMTYGEHAVGKQLKNGKKVWTNPYQKNRFLLYFTLILTMLTVSNTWDPVFDGASITLSLAIGKLLRISLVLGPVFLIGKGKLIGIRILILFFVIQFLALLSTLFYLAPSSLKGILQFYIYFQFVILVGLFASCFYYRKR